jgi:tetratricopeptide (TPR) repeat protein
LGGSDDTAGHFGVYLREMRERVNLSLEQVDIRSEEYGRRVTKSYLSRCELGEQIPDLPRLHTLSGLYGVSIEEFSSQFETCTLLAAGHSRDGRDRASRFSDLVARGRRAGQAGKHAESLALYQRAKRLAANQDDPVRARRSVSIGIAFALAALGKAEQAARLAMDLITESDDDLEIKGNSIVLLANTLNWRLQPGLAAALVRGFDSTLKNCGPQVRGRAKLSLSNAERAMGDADAAERAARRSLVEFKYCRGNLSNSDRAIAHYILAQALEAGGKRDLALNELKLARAHWKRDSAFIKVAQAYNESGEVYLKASNYPAARRHLSRASRLAREHGSRELLLASYLHLWQLEGLAGNASRSESYKRLAKRLRRNLPKDTPVLRSYERELEALERDD